MEMISILKQFIQAEREGDWKGHLKAVSKMLSYFAAAGDNLNLKSSYVYLQEMSKLEEVTLHFTQHSWMETTLWEGVIGSGVGSLQT